MNLKKRIVVFVPLILALARVVAAQSEPAFYPFLKCLKSADKNADKKPAEAVSCDLEVNSSTGELRLLSNEIEITRLAKSQVTHLVYERFTKQRVASGVLIAWPLLFTKGRKHFLTIQFKTPEGKRDFLSLSLDAGNYQKILDAVETATGVKVEKHLDEIR
jgi:hypothetical protein